MTDATTEFFAGLAARGHEPTLERVKGTLRFDLIEGRRTARWLVAIDKGDVAVSRRNLKADCVVRAAKGLFDGIASGAENTMAAVLRGAVSIEGEQALMVPFQRLFPAPRRQR
jgi:putative sterol carrier protein